MAYRQATSGSERLILAHASLLDQGRAHAIGLERGPDARVADGELTDLRRRDHVALEQARGEGQHVANVVKAVAGIVGGQVLASIDLKCQQVADGVGVFGAVQPVDDRPTGVGRQPGGVVERRFEPRCQPVVVQRRWTRESYRGHLSRPQLQYHALPDADLVAALANLIQRHGLQREIRGGELIVMTTDAVLIEEGALPLDRRRSAGSLQRQGCRKSEQHARQCYALQHVVSLTCSEFTIKSRLAPTVEQLNDTAESRGVRVP